MPYIALENVFVEFPVKVRSNGISQRKLGNARSVGGRIVREAGRVHVRALDDISLTVESGQRLGVIGHNGAGKSTLLRVLAGIIGPTRGTVSAEGKIACIFSTSAGMNGNATGLENIFLRGLMLGLSRNEIESRVHEIADLCGLGEFLHLPINTYSAGMRARLAFAITTSIDPEILILDEWIGAGDQQFSSTAKEKVISMVEQSSLLILASHRRKTIEDYCDRAVWLVHGRITASGTPSEVFDAYEEANKSRKR